jgi:hypothetical protein
MLRGRPAEQRKRIPTRRKFGTLVIARSWIRRSLRGEGNEHVFISTHADRGNPTESAEIKSHRRPSNDDPEINACLGSTSARLL